MFKLSFKNFLFPRIAPIFERLATAMFLIHFYKVCKTQGSGLYSLCKFRCAKFGTEGCAKLRIYINGKIYYFCRCNNCVCKTQGCANHRGVQTEGFYCIYIYIYIIYIYIPKYIFGNFS